MFKYQAGIWLKRAFIRITIQADDYDQALDLAKAFYPAADDIFVYGAEYKDLPKLRTKRSLWNAEKT